MQKIPNPPAGRARLEIIALLAAIMSINALAVDIVLPALPDISQALRIVHENQQQFVVLVYLVGFGAAQFFYGPILDRFGRRAPLIFGLAVYIVAGALCAYASDLNTLLLLRMIQGAGAAGTRVVAQTVTRDLFKGRAMAEVMSLVQMVFMITPVIAPSICLAVMSLVPWHGVFWFTALFGLSVIIWSYLRLPETLKDDHRRPLNFTTIAEGFQLVLSNRIAMGYMFASAFMFGGVMGFVGTAQQIYVGIYDLGSWFPLVFGGSAAGMAVSAYLNSRVVGRYGMRRIAHTGILIATTGAAILTAASLLGPVPLWLFFILISLPIFSLGWTAGNMISLAMEPLGNVAGSASAVFGAVQTLGGAVLGILTGQFFNGTVTPLAAGFLIFGLCSLLATLFAEKGKLFGVGVRRPD